MAVTQSQLVAELAALNQQDIWKGFSGKDKLFVSMLSLIATNGGGGSGGTSITQGQVQSAIESATNLDGLEPLLTAILAELQKRTIIQIVQNLAVGANTIVHNLALPSPFTTATTIVDNATETPILAPISSQAANSLIINSPIAYPNVRITIRS